MVALVVSFHIIASLVLILVVLLQSGKAGDLASTFGSSGSQTAFGARGAATMLTKATTFCAIIFMLTSLSLAIMFTRGSSGTVLEGIPQPEAPLESTTEPSNTSAVPPSEELPSAEQPGADQPSDQLPSEPAAEEGSGANQ
ncbi:MAG: preprotein translocase subunit SecG [Acidobacteria bacterium]|nr:preprotein translocase subunit SecG [Acidobacteriota bacterium]